jgi:hypothetical protein
METPTIGNAGAKGAWRARRSGWLGAGRAIILGMLHGHGDLACGPARPGRLIKLAAGAGAPCKCHAGCHRTMD